MRKVFLIVLFCLPLLLGQTVIRQNPADIAWDAVAPITGSTITYEVLVASLGDKTSFTIVGETGSLLYSVTLLSEGDWVIGVRTVRTIDSNSERLLSLINWSDVDGVMTPNPFIIRYYEVPVAPENLRLQ